MEREHAATVEPLTLEEFERLPEEDEFRLELVRGRLVREARPGARHCDVAGRIYYALETFAREAGGKVVYEGGFVLESDPPTVRGPDVAFIDASRLPSGRSSIRNWELAPDLAVEIVSPSNRPAATLEKVAEYLRVGVRQVWVVDPERDEVTVYRDRGEVRVLSAGDVLGPDDVLPGFRLDLAEVFAD